MATPMTPTQLLATLEAEGLTVKEYSGWRDRCRCHTGSHEKNVGWLGDTATRKWGALHGTVNHITAGNLGTRTVEQYIASAILGDPEIPCKVQMVVDPDGVVWLVSAGRSNHAGKVGANVEAHMIAADFALDDPYDDRFRGGDVDGNAFTYGVENIAAAKMNDKQRATSVKINAAIARHYGWDGGESVGHGEISSARYPADPNLDMGAFRLDVRTQINSATTPAPAPTPTPVKTALVRSASQNLAGNNAYGIATAAARVPRYVAARKETPVDVLSVQETTVASLVRPLLDSGLKGLMTRVGGGEGRYSYLGPKAKLIAAGMITVASKYWFQKDDKQASWVVYEINGIRAMDVNMHLESADGSVADDLRVKQGLNVELQARGIATHYSVNLANVAFCGDFNSEGLVMEALCTDALGWRNAAAGTAFENDRTFTGWDGASHKRFDYYLVHKTCEQAAVVAVSPNTKISDHAGVRCERLITL